MDKNFPGAARTTCVLESLVSPVLTAALLTVISFHNLFEFWTNGLVEAVIGLVHAAATVISASSLLSTLVLPSPNPSKRRRIFDRTTLGTRI